MVKDATGYDYSMVVDYPEEWWNDEDDWANLFERDDLGDVYELIGGLRDGRD